LRSFNTITGQKMKMSSGIIKTSPPEVRKKDSFFNLRHLNRTGNFFFQPKLTTDSTNAVYQREPDALTDKVVRIGDHEQMQTRISPVSIQRKCAACEEEEKLQRKENGTKETDAEAPSIVSDALGSGGSPLDNNSRSFMESRFGYDFSNVKIHTDAIAAKSAQSINALAYTSGNSIVFGEGQYSPNSDSGKRLLAHELTHVVQQNNNTARRLIQKNGDPAAAPVYGEACSEGASDPCQFSRCDGLHVGINNDFTRAMNYATAAYGALGASPLSQRTIDALDWYFNDHSETTVDLVRERMLCISLCLIDAFGGNQYGCHPDYSATAYVCVGSTPICTDAVTNVCLTNSYFSKSDRVRAEVLIHECAHRIGLSLGGSDFDIYNHRAHFLRLSTSEALMNADSFALFAGAITNGVRTTLLINPVFPFGVGLSGGGAFSGGTNTWYARMNYANFEFQHPAIQLFNPNFGVSLTLIGDSTSTTDRSVTASTSFLASLTAGFRITDPRPGPSIAAGSSNPIGIGAEAGVAVGYRWRWLDASAGGIYLHDPTRPEGMRDILTLGPTLTITFEPSILSIPGSY
jgi:hypothetical protein